MTEVPPKSGRAQPDREEWMVIGSIVGAFGVRGEAKVRLHTDFPRRFKMLERVYLGSDRTPMAVERSRLHKGQALLKLAGVNTPEQADTLRGQDVTVPRAEAVALPRGQFYLSDLLHAQVYLEDGTHLGPITDVLRTGSNDVWVVERGSETILVPAIKDAVIELDLDNAVVVVRRWVIQPPS